MARAAGGGRPISTASTDGGVALLRMPRRTLATTTTAATSAIPAPRTKMRTVDHGDGGEVCGGGVAGGGVAGGSGEAGRVRRMWWGVWWRGRHSLLDPVEGVVCRREDGR